MYMAHISIDLLVLLRVAGIRTYFGSDCWYATTMPALPTPCTETYKMSTTNASNRRYTRANNTCVYNTIRGVKRQHVHLAVTHIDAGIFSGT